MLPFTILALSLVALTSVAGDTQPLQFGSGSWQTSNPNHIVVSPSGREIPNPPNTQDPNNPSNPTDPSSIPPNCPTVAQTPTSSTSGPSADAPGKAQIAWCTPLLGKEDNATEPVVAWFTQVQPGDTAPTPTNATASGNGTETEEASAKKTPATKELGSCTPISLDGNEAGGEPQKPGQIGWYIPIPKPDEAAANNSSADDNTPGGNVTLGWCTPLPGAGSGDATKAQLGDCRPYESASPNNGSTTTTTPKPDAKKEEEPAKELLSWFTEYKYDPAVKGGVSYFIPVVASIPPPKEAINSDTKAPEAGGGDEAGAAPPKEA